MLYPIDISEEEIVVRFVFSSDFIKKKIDKDRINFRNFLKPYMGGVSVQRESFITKKELIKKGKLIENDSRKLVGFYKFKKKELISFIKEYKIAENLKREKFEAELFYTPLDSNDNYVSIPFNSAVVELIDGDGSHSDLIYLNPAIIGDESINIGLKSFVKKFYNPENLQLFENY